MFRCGVEIGVGLWVCHGFYLGLSWVAWVQIGVGDLGVVWRLALGYGFAVGCVGSDRRGFLLVARGNVERELFF